MKSDFLMTILANDLVPDKQKSDTHYLRLVFIANWVMLIALFVFLGTLTASYGFGHHLSLATQIAAHLLTIVSAAVFKLGYATRCVGAFNLGHKAF